MEIWDMAGSERYAPQITRTNFREAYGIIYIFAVDDEESLLDIKDRWKKEADLLGEDAAHNIIIANKIDLTDLRQITEEEGRGVA